MAENLDDELSRLIANVDISTPERLARFEKWRNEDGSRQGLQGLRKRSSQSAPRSVVEAIDQAKRILDDAIAEFEPVAIYAGFSGGFDSLVSTHFAIQHSPSIRPLHINTGIGIERTREYVRSTCGEFGWSLREERTTENYEKLVLEQGFPGPPHHGKMYNRLKERPIRRVVAEAKTGCSRTDTVMIITGIRADESKIRTGYKRTTSKVGSQVWVNPLYWSSIDVFREYRETHKLQANPVSAKLGFSGECLCGANAEIGELDRIEFVCPQTGAYLRDLERRVREAGFPWGYEGRPPEWWLDKKRGQGLLGDWFEDEEDKACVPGPMCNSCEKIRSE